MGNGPGELKMAEVCLVTNSIKLVKPALVTTSIKLQTYSQTCFSDHLY